MRSTYQKQSVPNFTYPSSTRGSSLFDFSQGAVSSSVSGSSSHMPANTYGQYDLYHNYEHTDNPLPENSKTVLPYPHIAISHPTIEEEDESPLNLIRNWDFNRRQFDGWLARSASFDSLDTQLGDHFINRTKTMTDNNPNAPPGFFTHGSMLKDSKSHVKRKWSDASTDTEFNPFKQHNIEFSKSPQNLYSTPCPTFRTEKPVFPKKKSLEKREYRGMFEVESVSNARYTGTLKFYQTKNKRYGFITLDEDGTDVFLCEDDLILSGINYKKFKEKVASKAPMKFIFNIKHYIENGKTKRKAVDLNLVYI
jgi:hypothetical protein